MAVIADTKGTSLVKRQAKKINKDYLEEYIHLFDDSYTSTTLYIQKKIFIKYNYKVECKNKIIYDCNNRVIYASTW